MNGYYLKSFLVLMSAYTTIIQGCANNKMKETDKSLPPGTLFFDYKIRGDEESGLVTVTLQYRNGAEDGPPVALRGRSKVEFDGEELKVDSSKMNGFYYETSRRIENFEGMHEIVVDLEGEQYREEFDFSVISLRNEPSPVIQRNDLAFELDGLDSIDLVHLIMTDTFFYSRGIDRVDTVKNGKLWVSRQNLANLKNGPVFLELFKEVEWPLKEATAGGGRLSISYNLRRAFELQDSSH